MTVRSATAQMAKPIGYEIGHTDDVIQADLLNGFFEGLADSMPFESSAFDTQVCCISKKLSEKSKRAIARLHEFNYPGSPV